MNTKFILVAFLACLATGFALSQDLDQIDCLYRSKDAQGRIGESKIREIVEKLRQALKDGFMGFPPLDPLDVKDYRLALDNKYINLDSNWTAVSEGLAGFDLSQLSLSLIGLKLKFQINFPKITGSGDYSADLNSPLISQRIFGKGKFDVNSDGLTVKGTGRVATKLLHGKIVVQIKFLEVDPSLKNFALALTGLMNDEELSKKISDKLTNELPTLLQEHKAKINQIITDIIPYVNDYLAGNYEAFGVDRIYC